jgi:hypothetical protein
MQTYLPLFSVDVEHTYFSGNLGPGLNFIPTPPTRAALEKANLLMRNTPNGIRVFYDRNNSEALQLLVNDPDEPLRTGFKVFSHSPQFKNYGNLKEPGEDSILYFDNHGAQKDAAGRFRLHHADYVSDADFEVLHSPRFENILNPKNRLVKPEFIFAIRLIPEELPQVDQPSNAAARNYYIRFKARETIWKYYLLGSLTQKKSYIVDLNSETKFDDTGPVSLPGNRTALTFRSKQKLPLREKSGYRFQLKEKDPGGGKVLIQRLPVASANFFAKENIGGKEAIISEIFINC